MLTSERGDELNEQALAASTSAAPCNDTSVLDLVETKLVVVRARSSACSSPQKRPRLQASGSTTPSGKHRRCAPPCIRHSLRCSRSTYDSVQPDVKIAPLSEQSPSTMWTCCHVSSIRFRGRGQSSRTVAAKKARPGDEVIGEGNG